MNLAELYEWAEEERPDLDEQIEAQDAAQQEVIEKSRRKKAFVANPPATIDVHPLADPRYWRHPDRGDGSKGSPDGAMPLQSQGDPYNQVVDMTAEQVFLRWYALRLTLARTRKPHTRAVAAKAFWAFRRELEKMPHMLRAAAWVEDQVKDSIQHKRIIALLETFVANGCKRKRQADHHFSQELREKVVQLYYDLRATGISEREACRRIFEAHRVSRTNVQRWVAQFQDESANALHARGKNEDMYTEMATLAERHDDHEQRIRELERQVGVPVGGPKAAETAVERFIDSATNDKEKTK